MCRQRHTVCRAALLFLFLVTPLHIASAKTIVIFAPHPDDETLCCAGIIYRAKANGDTVKVVVVTNGDIYGTTVGYQREGESVSALQLLGLSEQDVIFLGYGSGYGGALWDVYQSLSDTTIYKLWVPEILSR